MGLKEASLLDNGWQKLVSGLILQWATYKPGTLKGDVTITLNFPIAFPNKTLQVILGDTVGQVNAATQASEGMSIQKCDKVSTTIYVAWSSFPYPGDVTPPEIRLFAIGY